MNSISLARASLTKPHVPMQLGDFFQGKLVKLDDNGQATIRTTGGEMEAKLNSPLEVGKSYIFQVQKTENEILLKALPAPNTDVGKAVEALLKQLSFEKGGWEQRLLQLAIKEGWLQSKGNKLSLSLQWLGSSTSPAQDVKVVEWMNRASLPFTKEVFQSLSTVFSGKEISSLLHGLSDNSQVNLDRFQPFFSTIEEKLGLQMIKTALTPSSNPNASSVISQVISQLVQIHGGASGGVFQDAEQVLRIVAEPSTLKLWESGKQAFNNGNHQEALANWRGMLPTVQGSMTSGDVLELLLRQELEKQVTPFKLGQLDIYLKQESKVTSNGSFLQWLGKSMMTHTEGEINLTKADYEILMTLNRDIVVKELKQIVRMLGLNLEAEMAAGKTEGMESLKAQLIQLLHQDGVPQKQGIQELLSHLQGQKLLTQDMGPILQIFSQIPLSLIHGMRDANLYWSGKKTKEGKIDPNHCRVLFHLHLEKLGETLLDFQVQNQVASLYVYHTLDDFNPPTEEMREMLKVGLNKIGYQLSAFQFEYVQDKDKKTTFTPVYEQMQTLSKVDVRI